MTCKNCGAEISADDKFCPVCGLPTAQNDIPNYCMHCGARLTDGDRFCAVCGCPVGETKPVSSEKNADIATSRLDSHKKSGGLDAKTVVLLTFLLLCAAVFLAGTLLNWWQL